MTWPPLDWCICPVPTAPRIASPEWPVSVAVEMMRSCLVCKSEPCSMCREVCSVGGCEKEASGEIEGSQFCERHYAVVMAQGRPK
jgi:hypothetical protein